MNFSEKVTCPPKQGQIIDLCYVSVVVCFIVVHNNVNLFIDNYILDNISILK